MLTVALCTWNRADLLRRTLASLCQLEAAGRIPWELLVVDNNSTDRTRDVLGQYQHRLPLKVLAEPTPGLSHARNRALAHARGNGILWTDDDVRVDRNWLVSYAGAFERWPEALYFGGRIVPEFDSDPPPWIHRCGAMLDGLLVRREFGPTERKFDAGEAPFGANMAFRRSVFDERSFDVSLGRVRNTALLGEESALISLIHDSGGYGVWVPDALVHHWIPDERLCEESVRDYFRGEGRTIVRRHNATHRQLPWKYRLAAALGGSAGKLAVSLGRCASGRTPMKTFIRTAVCEGLRSELRSRST